MDNWTYFATYQSSNSDTRALPASFSELFITTSSHVQYSPMLANFLIPQVIIPNVNSIDQSLGLVYPDGKNFTVLRIWTGGMMLYYVRDDGTIFSTHSYDVYYR